MAYKENLLKLLQGFKYIKRYKTIQIYIILISMVMVSFTLLDPIILKFTIDEFFFNKKISAFLIIAGFYLCRVIFGNTFMICHSYLKAYMGSFLSLKMRRDIFQKIITVKAEKEKDINVGEVLVSFGQDIGEVEKTVTSYVFELLELIVQTVSIVFILLFLSWEYLFAIWLIGPVLTYFNNKFWLPKLKLRYEELKKTNAVMCDFLSEMIINLKNIKIMVKEKYVEKLFFKRNKDVIEKKFASSKIGWINYTIVQDIAVLDKLFIWGVSAYLLYINKITLGTFLALNAYEAILKYNIARFVNINIDLNPFIVSIERIENILKLEKEEIKGKKIKKIQGEIEFKNIDFYYEADNEKILKNFNLKINKGEKIAVVGESGSGKSTIIKLLLGLYPPSAGEILIDGLNLNKINLNSYRKRLGVVMQENFFFSDTVYENLTLGDKKTEEEVVKALKIAQFSELIEDEKLGLYTIMEPDGSNFSGGQRQRLSIAKMILQNPDFIILDEATSALDNITEAKIQKSLKKELKDKTVITIAHRLSTIEDADRILVFDKGEVVEQGTHESLVIKKGYYYSLLNRKTETDEIENIEE